jgi:hypothetical protein
MRKQRFLGKSKEQFNIWVLVPAPIRPSLTSSSYPYLLSFTAYTLNGHIRLHIQHLRSIQPHNFQCRALLKVKFYITAPCHEPNIVALFTKVGYHFSLLHIQEDPTLMQIVEEDARRAAKIYGRIGYEQLC